VSKALLAKGGSKILTDCQEKGMLQVESWLAEKNANPLAPMSNVGTLKRIVR